MRGGKRMSVNGKPIQAAPGLSAAKTTLKQLLFIIAIVQLTRYTIAIKN